MRNATQPSPNNPNRKQKTGTPIPRQETSELEQRKAHELTFTRTEIIEALRGNPDRAYWIPDHADMVQGYDSSANPILRFKWYEDADPLEPSDAGS
jgi:hypothetical protein